MSIEIPINVNMEVEESKMAFDMDVVESSESLSMDVSEEIDVTVVQGTDVSDTTAIESDVLEGKKFHKADGSLATGTHEDFVPAPYNDVVFWDDYVGEIAYSYSASEFMNLSEMPQNPVHSGMTSQGWNWTLADAKTQLATTGFLSVGQMYVTADGKTRAYITIPNNARKTVKVNWRQTVAYGVSVNFGDGSSDVTASGTGKKNAVHEYAVCGNYVITFTVSSGTLSFGDGGNSATLVQSGESAVRYPYCAMLRRLEIGANVEDIYNNCLYNSYLLETITIPNTIALIGDNALYASYSMRHITIPSSCTSIGGGVFRAMRSLCDISFPKQVTAIGANSLRDFSIVNVALPPLTAITEYMFAANTMISRLVIPSTVTSIAANAFNGNVGMKEYHFKSATPPAVASSNAFTSIPSDCVIYVPSGSLLAYTSASNYPSSETYTYIEE